MNTKTRQVKSAEAETESGRKAITRSISMMPDDVEGIGEVNWEWVDGRVKQLKPRLKGLSHYFQMLADLDKREGLLERIIGPANSTSGARAARDIAAHVIQNQKGKRRSGGATG